MGFTVSQVGSQDGSCLLWRSGDIWLWSAEHQAPHLLVTEATGHLCVQVPSLL